MHCHEPWPLTDQKNDLLNILICISITVSFHLSLTLINYNSNISHILFCLADWQSSNFFRVYHKKKHLFAVYTHANGVLSLGSDHTLFTRLRIVFDRWIRSTFSILYLNRVCISREINLMFDSIFLTLTVLFVLLSNN